MNEDTESRGGGSGPTNADGRGSVPGLLHARLGDDPFATLAERLYARIDRDPRIRSLFPPDLGPSSESVRDMREFLVQFFGGAPEYSRRKGHPRLRARHMRFPIDQAARDAWLENAIGALGDAASSHALDGAAVAEIEAYLIRTSQFMINREESHGAGG
jgi:hemoglobin